MEVRFWGVRGSIPCGSAAYSRYGGDTSCVSVYTDDIFVVFDAGSGFRAAGNFCMENNIKHTHLFLSHMHIDHILGLPFYGPVWDSSKQMTVYGIEVAAYGGVKSILNQAFAAPLFPVQVSGFQADVDYVDYPAGKVIQLNEYVQIRTARLDHPNGAVAFQISNGTSKVCYVTDTGHLTGEYRKGVLALIKGADMVIYDASLTCEELKGKEYWGHSTWKEGIILCQEAEAKALCLFHHSPEHDDQIMDQIVVEAQQSWNKVYVAKQGMVFKL